MLAMDVKMQKIEPDPNFLWQMKVSEAVCKRDWQREVVFIFNVQKFQTKISDSVCNDLNSIENNTTKMNAVTIMILSVDPQK